MKRKRTSGDVDAASEKTLQSKRGKRRGRLPKNARSKKKKKKASANETAPAKVINNGGSRESKKGKVTCKGGLPPLEAAGRCETGEV